MFLTTLRMFITLLMFIFIVFTIPKAPAEYYRSRTCEVSEHFPGFIWSFSYMETRTLLEVKGKNLCLGRYLHVSLQHFYYRTVLNQELLSLVLYCNNSLLWDTRNTRNTKDCYTNIKDCNILPDSIKEQKNDQLALCYHINTRLKVTCEFNTNFKLEYNLRCHWVQTFLLLTKNAVSTVL